MAVILIVTGATILAVGLVLYFFSDLPFGKLPGDITHRTKNFTFHFPLATSLVISIILSLVLYLVAKLR